MPSRRALLASFGTATAASGGCLNRVRGNLDGDRRIEDPCGGATNRWPTVGGDAGRTGRTDTAPPPADADAVDLLVGRRTGHGAGLAASLPSVAHGTAFVPSGTAVVARDLAAPGGEPTWTHDVDDDVDTTPVHACGAVFALGLNTLTAIDPDTGERYWQADVGGFGTTPFGVHNDTMYVGGSSIGAFDVRTGDELWRGGRGRTVAVDDAGLYTTEHHDGTGSVAGYDHDGEQRWRLALGKVVGSASVLDGRVYVVDTEGTVYAIAAGTGETRWSRPLEGVRKVHSGLAVGDGDVVVPAGTGDTSVVVDADTGEPRWTANTGIVTGRPVVGDDLVAFGRTNVGVTVYDRTTGEERGTWTRDAYEFGTVAGLVPLEEGFLVRGGTTSGLTALR